MRGADDSTVNLSTVSAPVDARVLAMLCRVAERLSIWRLATAKSRQ